MSAIDPDLGKWDPMRDDYINPEFNSYDRGPGRNLPKEHNPAVKYNRQLEGKMPTPDRSGIGLYIKRIPRELNNEGLRNMFLKCGTVLRAHVVQPKVEDGREDTIGFVNMATLSEAERAIREMDGFQIDRFRIRVEICKSEEEKERQRNERRKQEEFLKSLPTSRDNPHRDSLPALERSYQDSDSESTSRTTPTSNDRRPAGRSGMQYDNVNSHAEESMPPTFKGSSPGERSRHGSGDTVTSIPPLMEQQQNYTSYRGRGVSRGYRGRRPWRGQHMGYRGRGAYQGMPMSPRMPYPMYPPMPFYGYYPPMYPPHPQQFYPAYPSYDMGQGDGQYIPSHQRYGGGGNSPEYGSPHKRTFSPSSGSDGQSNRKEMPPLKPIKKCAYCQTTGSTFHCGRCKTTYCNRECQTKDWPHHKELCKQIVLANKSEEMFSKFDITVGDDLVSNVAAKFQASSRNDDVGSPQRSQQNKTVDSPMKSSTKKFQTPPRDSDQRNTRNYNKTSPKATDYGSNRSVQTSTNSNTNNSSMTPNVSASSQALNKAAQTAASATPPKQHSRFMAASLPVASLPPQRTCQVFVPHFEDPKVFWVQVATDENATSMAKLSAELNERYAQSKNDGYTPQIGELCAAQFSADKSWYRARVDSVGSDGSLSVTFVDYGNKENVSVSEIRSLEPQFTKTQSMAVRCGLAGISSPPGGTWSNDAKQQCYAKIMDGVRVEAKLIGEGVGKVAVRLSVPGCGDISDWLVESGFAGPSGRVPAQTMPKVPVPVKTMPKAPVQIQSYQIGDMALFADMLKVDEQVQMLLTELTSLGDFWMQVYRDAAEFEALVASLNAGCSKKTANKEYTPKKDDVVCAKFSQDGTWYRGHVLEIKGNGNATVLYLDFGNKEDVPVSDIHPLEKGYLSEPARAVNCRLANVAEPFLSDALVYFNERVQAQLMNVKIVQSEKHSGQTKLAIDVFNSDMQTGLIDEMLALKLINLTLPDTSRISQPILQSPITREKLPPANPKLSDLAQSSFSSTGAEIVHILHINSAKDFYVQCNNEDSIKTISDLFQNLNLAYATDANRGSPTSVSAGDLVCASFEGDWYRAVVLDVNAQHIQVSYIDFGNENMVNPDEIQTLLPEFLKYPVQAIHCGLHGVDRVTDEDTQYLKNISVFHATPIGVKEGPGPIMVELKLCDEQQTPINSLMKGAEAAAQHRTHAEFGEVLQQTTQAAVSQSSAVVAPVAMLNTMEFVKPQGKNVKVVVTEVYSPQEFYCQLAYKQEIELLDMLMNSMSHQHDTVKSEPIDPVIGQVCSVFYLDDKLWYRAVVCEKKGSDLYNVHYLDFGNTEDVPLSRIRVVPDEFLELPVMAFKCSLAGIKPSSGSWNPVCQEVFQHNALNKILDAEIVSVDDDLYNLVLKNESGDVDIAEVLISEGLAVRAKPVAQQQVGTPPAPAVQPSAPVASPAPSPAPQAGGSADEVADLKAQIQRLEQMVLTLAQGQAKS